ncbi:WD repeat-containing protein 93 [Lampris incognitus]|uniref:WD repeat-containing protein 93 n=1 Tax=Lampris incognitus TaxID=2546036 RepID=UPI0024B5141D|nr:WD repeat-containing protein 93 [Lampris incognitus]
MDIPEPSDNDWSENEDVSSLVIPVEPRDHLPQPFRMVNKILDSLFDIAWDIVSKRETAREAEKSKKKPPTLEPSRATQLSLVNQLPESPNCLACSEDGRYIGMGHSCGLSVNCVSSLICVSAWLEDSLEITSIQITSMSERAYLLGTVDDMGVARVFLYHAEIIHLLKVINKTENINQRSICTTFELSKGGHYGAATISCNGALWLEVYHLPIEAWLKELQMAVSQNQAQNQSGSVDVKWSPTAVALKINPPKIPAGTTLRSPCEVLQKTNGGHVIRSGQNHMISSHQWEEQDAVFRSTYRKYLSVNNGKTKEIDKSPSHCTKHFLLPCGLSAGLSEAKPQPGIAVALCVWWSGSHNLFQYSLCRVQKDKPDAAPKPDVLWPNAQEILCSAVSSCTRYIALGLDDALVTVWDRLLGLPLSAVLVSEADSTFTRMLFVDCKPVSDEESLCSQLLTAAQVHLLVTCKSGAIHILTTGRRAGSSAVQLTERPRDSGGLPTVIASVPFLQGLILVIQKNGKIFLQDVLNKTTVCYLSPPITHQLATPWDPVYTLDTKQQCLFIQGDELPSNNATMVADCQNQLFAFHFGEHPITKPYIAELPGLPSQQKGMSFATLEEACNLYLQQRVLSGDERNKAVTHTWSQLQEHTVTVQRARKKHDSNTASQDA